MTTSRTVRRSLLAALALLGASIPAARSAAEPPSIPYLVEDAGVWTIHDGSTSVPLPASIVDNTDHEVDGEGTFALVGKTGATYVVSERAVGLNDGEPEPPTSYELHLVAADGTASTAYEKVSEDDPATSRLSDDGSQVFVASQDEGSYDTRIVGLDGHVRQLPDAWIDPAAVDFPGPRRLLFTDYQATRAFHGDRLGIRYIAKNRTVTIFRGQWQSISVGDIDGDVFAVEAQRKHAHRPATTTFRRLSEPHRALWTAKFAAYELGPTSKRVLGRGQGAAGTLQVRRVSDGRIVGKLYPGIDFSVATWQDSRHVLFAHEGTVVRCSVAGACETVPSAT